MLHLLDREMKKLLTIVCLGVTTAFAQQSEPMLSQYFNTPLQINPANAGLFNGQARLVTNFRQQWESFGVGYQTIGASGDFVLARDLSPNDFFGLGFDIVQDQAGKGGLTSFAGKASVGYTKALDPSKEHFFSVGFGAGFNQRSVVASQFNWGAQWTDRGFDPTKSTVDQGMDEAVTFFDLSVGANYYYSAKNDRTKGFIGGAMMHANTPTVSFLNNEEEKIERKYVINGSLKNYFGRNYVYALNPSFIYAFQGKSYNLIYGVDFEFILNKGSRSTGAYKHTSIAFGIYHRWSQAFMPMFKLNKAGFSLCASYDMEVGNVTRVTNGQGGMEISLQYRVGYKNGKDRRNMNRAFL